MITFNECLPILNNLFKMNDYRINKCRVLFELAQQAGGPIVELGSYHGMSTIALDKGSGDNQVYAVDDWDRVGWAGETYRQNDYKIFESNLACAKSKGIWLETFDIAEAAALWSKGGVSLIFWDTGVEDCLLEHFQLWSRHLKPGGLFLVHDTVDCRLGWNELKKIVTDFDAGYGANFFLGNHWQVEEHGTLHGLRKP